MRAGEAVSIHTEGLRLDRDEFVALCGLIGDMAFGALPAHVAPRIVAMRLLAESARAQIHAFADTAPERVLIHEAQATRCSPELRAGVDVIVSGTFSVPAANAARVTLRVSDRTGEPLADLDTRLALVDPKALVAAPAPLSAAKRRPSQADLHCGPISGAQVALFARLAGDANPLHTDLEAALAFGLPERVVHGSLLIAVAEAALAKQWPDRRTRETRTRFLAPVFVGEGLGVSVASKGASGSDGARVSVWTHDGRLACVVDAALA